MSRLIRLSLLALALAFLPLSQAEAGRIGKSETLRPLGESSFEVPGKGKFQLGYKFTTYWLVAGVWLTNDGYVLLPEGKSGQYIPLDSEKKAVFQKAGMLPETLPSYRIPKLDYAFGFSAWIVILGSILVGKIQEMRNQA